MNKVKMWSGIAVGACALAFLAGCASEGRSTDVPAVRTADLGGTVTSGTITVDGHTVPCVTWVSGTGQSSVGGISCDWAKATPVK